MGAPLLLRHPSSAGFRQDAAVAGLGHPERPERIAAIDAALEASGGLGYEPREAPAATFEQLCAVHPAEYVERLRDAARGGDAPASMETVVDGPSWTAALHAAGGACTLVEALVSGAAPTGFCLLRPPGHHADGTRPMGFCLLDNVAVGAQHALDALGVARVFILDWDVHHGNGTNEIFRYSDRVLFASIHQANAFPGTGPLTDAGSGRGEGYSINLPVDAGTDGEVWRSLVEHVVVPAAQDFRPELVLISAGFDAHVDDPSADCRLEVEDFAELARQARDLGARCGAPVGAVLEGGYELDALGASAVATMAALAGEGRADSVAPEPVYTSRAASHVGHYWELM